MSKSIRKTSLLNPDHYSSFTNIAFGIEPGVKSDISPVESFIIYR